LRYGSAVLRAKCAVPLFVVAFAAVFGACSASRTDCTCAFDNGGQHRTLACGEHACVGGVSASCAAKDELVRGGDCAAPPEVPADGGGVSEEPPPVDTSCDELLTFCATSCTAPAVVAADCLTTASSGAPELCAQWSVANGALCSP
jgi:hypothetical protein